MGSPSIVSAPFTGGFTPLQQAVVRTATSVAPTISRVFFMSVMLATRPRPVVPFVYRGVLLVTFLCRYRPGFPMLARMNTAAKPEPPASDRNSLKRNDVLLILAFWAFIAVLAAVNGLIDPRGRGLQPVWPSAPVALAFIESALWAAITPFVFWLVSRYGIERTNRVARIALFLGIGLVLAIVVVWRRDGRHVLPETTPAPARITLYRLGTWAFGAITATFLAFHGNLLPRFPEFLRRLAGLG